MQTRDDGGSAMRAIAVAALALAGLAFSLTPVAAYLDNTLLDAAWRILRRLDRSPAPDDIVIVGIDEASVAAIAEPPGLWHAALGQALSRLAGARPRAILFDFPLPDRSYDSVKPGVDRALFAGLAAALDTTPFVAALNIDPRTRSARNIHRPYLALLGEPRLGLGLVARDADGVARRFSLLVPTDDGGFPTVVGRLCRQLRVECVDGLIHYSLGKPFTYVPLKSLLQMSDEMLVRPPLPRPHRAHWRNAGLHRPRRGPGEPRRMGDAEPRYAGDRAAGADVAHRAGRRRAARDPALDGRGARVPRRADRADARSTHGIDRGAGRGSGPRGSRRGGAALRGVRPVGRGAGDPCHGRGRPLGLAPAPLPAYSLDALSDIPRSLCDVSGCRGRRARARWSQLVGLLLSCEPRAT
jgi:hypothetical protein